MNTGEDLTKMFKETFGDTGPDLNQEKSQDTGKLSNLGEIVSNKELRRDIDYIIQRLKFLPSSRERSLSITKLQEAVMWLGMDLKRLNDTNPYPSSKDPSTGAYVEPAADGLKL